MRMIFLTTEQVFNQQKYQDEAIETRSRILTRQVDQTKPSWLSGDLSVNMLEDEIAYLQYGQATETEFYGYKLGVV